METIYSDCLVSTVALFGILLMFGGLARDPWQFASRPYRWLFQTVQNMLSNNLQRLLRLLARATQGIFDLIISGVIVFCRRFPVMATIILVITIAIIALAHAGFL